MNETAAPKPLSKRQGLKDGMTVGFWPELDAFPEAVREFGNNHACTTTLSDADFLAVNVPDRVSAIAFVDNNLT